MSLSWGPVFAQTKEARTEPLERRDLGAYRLGGQILFCRETARPARVVFRLVDAGPAFAAIARNRLSPRAWVAVAEAAEGEARRASEFQPGPMAGLARSREVAAAARLRLPPVLAAAWIQAR